MSWRRSLAAALPAWAVGRLLTLVALAAAEATCDDFGRGPTCNQGLLGWDAAWYRDIAEHGYDGVPREGLRFFPLVPLLARLLGLVLGGRDDVALVVLANASALVLGALVHHLARVETGDDRLARRAAWFVALAPAAFVLVMGYAEATAGALAAGVFVAMRRRAWGWAAVLGFLAGLARPVSVLLVVPVVVEAWRGVRSAGGTERLARIGAAAAPAAGLGAYLLWAGVRFGDALEPLRIQQRSQLRGSWANPITTVLDAVAGLVRGDRVGTGLHVVWILVLAGLVVVAFQRLPASYGWYAFAVFGTAVSADNLDSLERYAFSAFPVVIAAAVLTASERVERVVMVTAGGVLTGYATLAFLGVYIP